MEQLSAIDTRISGKRLHFNFVNECFNFYGRIQYRLGIVEHPELYFTNIDGYDYLSSYGNYMTIIKLLPDSKLEKNESRCKYKTNKFMVLCFIHKIYCTDEMMEMSFDRFNDYCSQKNIPLIDTETKVLGYFLENHDITPFSAKNGTLYYRIFIFSYIQLMNTEHHY
jgi:hypothetical protein